MLNSCYFDTLCINGSGAIITETRTISEFNEIRSISSADVFYTQADTFSIIVEAYENLMPVIKTSVSGDVLEISVKGCISSVGKINVYITAPQLFEVSNTGSGELRIAELFTTTDFYISNTGSGGIYISDFYADYVETTITGSGNVGLKGDGTCTKQDILITGSGDLDVGYFITNKAIIKTTGSGDCRLHVLEVLDATITGSGSIYYKGYPEIYEKNTGSGNLISGN